MTQQQTFRSYLFDQLGQESPYGDLAKDAKADLDWEGDTAASLRSRLHDLRSPLRVFEVLEESRRLYEQATHQSPAHKILKGMPPITCNECEGMGFFKADWECLSKAYLCPICDGFGLNAIDPNGDNDWQTRIIFYGEADSD